jgi:hypothetical protein
VCCYSGRLLGHSLFRYRRWAAAIRGTCGTTGRTRRRVGSIRCAYGTSTVKAWSRTSTSDIQGYSPSSDTDIGNGLLTRSTITLTTIFTITIIPNTSRHAIVTVRRSRSLFSHLVATCNPQTQTRRDLRGHRSCSLTVTAVPVSYGYSARRTIA